MPNLMTLTPDLAHASGWDAGNASMRAGGRTAWNEEDAAIATATMNRLMAHCLPADMLRAMRWHALERARRPTRALLRKVKRARMPYSPCRKGCHAR